MQEYRTDPQLDDLIEPAIALAKKLIIQASIARTRKEKNSRKRFAKLLNDQQSIEVIIALTDEVMRIKFVPDAIEIFRKTAAKASIVGFGFLNFLGIRILIPISYLLPNLALHLIHRTVRSLSRELILPDEELLLNKHIDIRKKEGINLNINVLGEAVMGESQANDRFTRVIEMMHRESVDYISVKLSSIVSQLITIDTLGSEMRVREKLRTLYRSARLNGVFINLDMEEYRDLHLTVNTFKQVLSEPEFLSITAGIVLQAYLPDSQQVLIDILAWTLDRYKKGGSFIKIRLVKGANLAMEHAEAELHQWIPATFPSKAEVDASYCRLLDLALRSEYAKALRIGIASHNLFDIAWSMEVAKSRGVESQLDIEMLEGMANAEARVVCTMGYPVLLYAPVTKRDDFSSAIAYLVRRLDENTSNENYLKAAFVIDKDELAFIEQKDRFRESVIDRHSISASRIERDSEFVLSNIFTPFQNEPASDPTNPEFVEAILSEFKKVNAIADLKIPLTISSDEIFTVDMQTGLDPNFNGDIWYRYSIATVANIESAIENAHAGFLSWSAESAMTRKQILDRAATIMAIERVSTIAIMARDAGKTVSEADPEVCEAIDFARFYGGLASKQIDSTPVGVVLVIPPWNFPYAIAAGGVLAALAVGNAVILKPAPETVATAWKLVNQLWRAGIPRQALQFLPTRDDASGKYLVTHSGVDSVILTGSFDTAKLFLSWKPQLKLAAETSGKNAITLTAGADIDAAVKELVQSAFGHAGQKCSAASLAIVDVHIYEDPAFFRQLVDAVNSLTVGPGTNLETFMGPLIRPPEPSLHRALTRLDVGEQWLVQPRQLDDQGYLWRPGVKIGVAAGSWSHLNEWFGPVLAIMCSPNLPTSIAWQNQVEFGLTAGIQSLNVLECETWIEEIQAGNLYINRGITGAVVYRQPFGGWKRSSVGATAKAGGANYLNTLQNFDRIKQLDLAISSAITWWENFGSVSVEVSGLTVEKNYHRYRRYLKPILVRISELTSEEELDFLDFLASKFGVRMEKRELGVDGIEVPIPQLAKYSKIRWLPGKESGTEQNSVVEQALKLGISVDFHPLAQRGEIEVPRWLLEQSVAISSHRYGNPHAGPKPKVIGL
jgi:RHH-type proline utilization regulon transcriptional repressor/proline dehydrogenase/delta 1-pyrroline-5-carboxylate dehydrogenase